MNCIFLILELIPLLKALAEDVPIVLKINSGTKTDPENVFQSTPRFAKRQNLGSTLARTILLEMFATTTWNVMGTNMGLKWAGEALETMQERVSDTLLMGNYYTDNDYSRVLGACCENVVGCISLPLSIAGLLQINGQNVHILMVTAEGTLVASTSRGRKVLNASGGVTII
jgi:hydroxymethylglutaryl-CoA reductase